MTAATTPPLTAPAPLALLTGGKSAGHVFPALAVGEELRGRGWRLAYAGQSQSMEERLAAAHEVDFHPLAARPLVGRGVLARLRALATLARSAIAARALVRRLGASAVVATGGFVSAPAVLGGWLARRLVVLLEPNAEPGTANRLLSRFADFAALGHAAAAAGLRCHSAVYGVPVRREFAAVPDLEVASSERALLVLGGSQGAERLNRAVPDALARLSPSLRVSVLHQTGDTNLEAAIAAYQASFTRIDERRFERGGVTVELAPFVDDVAAALARCQLVVSRAGAITLAELCAAGRGSVLVPLRLAGGHQQANARALEEAGAAVAVDADPRTPLAPEPFAERLAEALDALLTSPDRLRRMGAAARSLAVPAAAAGIAERIDRLVGRAAA